MVRIGDVVDGNDVRTRQLESGLFALQSLPIKCPINMTGRRVIILANGDVAYEFLEAAAATRLQDGYNQRGFRDRGPPRELGNNRRAARARVVFPLCAKLPTSPSPLAPHTVG